MTSRTGLERMIEWQCGEIIRLTVTPADDRCGQCLSHGQTRCGGEDALRPEAPLYGNALARKKARRTSPEGRAAASGTTPSSLCRRRGADSAFP